MPHARDADAEERVLTVPNLLSAVRLACVPLFLWLLFGEDDRYAAALLLAALGATDWVDGYVARHFHQTSNLGRILDPTADRILLLVGIGAILVDGSVPAWVAIAALGREALVAIAALVLASMGATRIDVQWVGKAGTFALMVAFPLFLAAGADIGWADTAEALAWLWAVPGLLLSWYSVLNYIPLARSAVREGRVGSAP